MLLAQKPSKPNGAVKCLRPIILPEIYRGVLLKILLSRIQPKVNTYLSKRKNSYRIGRSIACIVWAYRWILAKIQKQDLTGYSVSIDVSTAIGTIWRNKLVEIA